MASKPPIVTCEQGELKTEAEGLTLYDSMGAHPIVLSAGSGYQGLFTDIRSTLRSGNSLRHDARWGKAGVEAMLAVLQSAREGQEVALIHQVPLPLGY